MTEQNKSQEKKKFKVLSLYKSDEEGKGNSCKNGLIVIITIWVVVFILGTIVGYLYLTEKKDSIKKEAEFTARVTQKLEGISSDISKKDEGITKLSGIIETTNKDIISINTSLQKKIEVLELENKNLLQEIHKNEQDISELTWELGGLKAEKEKMTVQLNKLTAENGIASSKISILTKGIEDGKEKIKEEKAGLLKIMQKQESETARLKAELDKYKKEGISIHTEGEGGGDISKLKEEIKSLNEKIVSNEKKFNKKRGEMHYNLGYVFDFQGDYAKAEEEYKKALQLVPEDKNTNYNLAIIYHDYLKKSELAIKHYKRYLEISPNAEDREKVEGWIRDLEGN